MRTASAGGGYAFSGRVTYDEVGGIKLPTRHRIFPRDPDGQSLAEPLIVSIDLSEVAFTSLQ